MATGPRRPGEFCWFNMLTPDPEASRRFFAEVLGWNYVEISRVGQLARVDGHDIGAVFDLAAQGTPPGTPAHVAGLLQVANADASCAQVTALGGSAKPAFDIATQGRMAVCADPAGAAFDLWQPNTFHGTTVDPDVHGAPSWFELLTSDPGQVARFYAGVLGWTAKAMDTAEARYTDFLLEGEEVAGMMPVTPSMGPIHPHWRTYFTVDDRDAAVARAVALGAAIAMRVRDIPGVGRIAGLVSPQGVAFDVIEYKG